MHQNFVLKVMQFFGFDDNFMGQNRDLFAFVRILILVNGLLKVHLFCFRGVQQGNLLSSLIFCIVKDFLSKYLGSLVDNMHFLQISSPRGNFMLTHFYMQVNFSFLVVPTHQTLRFFKCMNTFLFRQFWVTILFILKMGASSKCLVTSRNNWDQYWGLIYVLLRC